LKRSFQRISHHQYEIRYYADKRYIYGNKTNRNPIRRVYRKEDHDCKKSQNTYVNERARFFTKRIKSDLKIIRYLVGVTKIASPSEKSRSRRNSIISLKYQTNLMSHCLRMTVLIMRSAMNFWVKSGGIFQTTVIRA